MSHPIELNGVANILTTLATLRRGGGMENSPILNQWVTLLENQASYLAGYMQKLEGSSPETWGDYVRRLKPEQALLDSRKLK